MPDVQYYREEERRNKEALLAQVDDIPTKAPTEPAITVGSITSSLTGIAAIVLYFAPNLVSSKYLGPIAIVGALAIPILQAILTRKRVWSPASVQEVVDLAVANALEEAKKQRGQSTISLRKQEPPRLL